MTNHYYGIKEIWQKDSSTLGIVWTDGVEHSFDVQDLRKNCPCSICKEKKHHNNSYEEIKPKTIQSMGSYALKIDFTDGHNTGIYTFNMLRNHSSRKPST
jgi:DUF971 family protein